MKNIQVKDFKDYKKSEGKYVDTITYFIWIGSHIKIERVREGTERVWYYINVKDCLVIDGGVKFKYVFICYSNLRVLNRDLKKIIQNFESISLKPNLGGK